MNLLPLEKLGARCTPDGIADFGVFFPWVSENDGNDLLVKVIHEKDQFLQDFMQGLYGTHSKRLFALLQPREHGLLDGRVAGIHDGFAGASQAA